MTDGACVNQFVQNRETFLDVCRAPRWLELCLARAVNFDWMTDEHPPLYGSTCVRVSMHVQDSAVGESNRDVAVGRGPGGSGRQTAPVPGLAKRNLPRPNPVTSSFTSRCLRATSNTGTAMERLGSQSASMHGHDAQMLGACSANSPAETAFK